MWMLFVFASLAAALAALGFTLFADAKGWAGMSYLGTYLAVWLPLSSVATLALLCGLAARNGVRWATVAALSLALATLQFSFIVYTNGSRVAMSFLPAVLLALGVAALVSKSHGWMDRAGLPLLALGLLTLAGTFGARAVERRKAEAASAANAAEEARKDATLHGLERAAWLLGREFYMDNFDASEFLRTKIYREPRSRGEYRWDDGKNRLVLVRPLFTEAWRRDQILPHAERALRTNALRPGPRADLHGAILECRPPLDCTVTWEFDVHQMHPADRPMRAEVAAIEAAAWNEINLR